MQNEQLDQEFVEKQRQRLQEVKAELERMVGGLEEDQQFRAEEEGDMTQHDSGDMSHSMFTRELDAGVQQTVEGRLRNVERALKKIEERTYGICDATGEPISRGRLEAVPEALYTMEAQQRQERPRGQRRQI